GFNAIAGWTADGSRLITAGTVNGTNGLWSIASDGSGLSLLKADPGVNYGFVGRILAPPTNGSLPQWIGASPASGSIGQSLWTTNILIALNRAIVADMVNTSSVVFSGSNYSVASLGSRISIQPALPLRPGTTYTSTVAA